LASPCAPLDLPQNELEPLLIRAATTQGFRCRFDTEFLSFEEDTANGTVDVLVKDLVYGRESTIRTKYLFGADGARSSIVRQLALPLTKREGGGLAWSVLVDADLSQYMDTRRGNLHWVYEPGTDQPDFA
jgi:2-polyprenyl-6-methoxyphenol hydroxylase-like FAD-dependent oxidoreductase